ncbi:MAG: phosphoserine transaminase [Rhodobacteraceae bacterium]|nr:phosphoserine transaminase [Paracoccaceae bacterium]
MIPTRPVYKPNCPNFSSGPCKKPPDWTLDILQEALLGRSHRSQSGKERLSTLIQTTKEVLEIPDEYRVGIVPASDTGAVEMAMWSLFGSRPVELIAWEAFGLDWKTDVLEQLEIPSNKHIADFGQMPDLFRVNFDNDVVFTWNGTTSGVCVPNGDFIPESRGGLILCDATSAVFAMDLPWNKLDVTTFSWQKVMGGEAGHGMIILSPRAVDRLESWQPKWPLPKIFRMTKDGKLIEGIFEGATINTPSMLCVEDFLYSLSWGKSQGGLRGLVARTKANAAVIERFVAENDWLDYLPSSPEIRSTTSVCLKFTHSLLNAGNMTNFSKRVVARLENEEVAFDIKNYKKAPPGLRIWCGATVEKEDLELLMPWIKWAFETEIGLLEQD